MMERLSAATGADEAPRDKSRLTQNVEEDGAVAVMSIIGYFKSRIFVAPVGVDADGAR